MTPYIQELRRRAEWLKDYGVKTMICEPPSILALIEVAEAAQELVDVLGPQIWETRQTRLRTALKGVKK